MQLSLVTLDVAATTDIHGVVRDIGRLSAAHPLNSWARAVQKDLSQDAAIEQPSYTFCLRAVELNIEAARTHASDKAVVLQRLVAVIRPQCRKAGAP